MFIGAINTDTRILLEKLMPELRSLPVYVGCSGNFTVERLLARNGLKEMTSNDVSLYSTAIGNYLMGRKFQIGIKDKSYDWLEEYLTTGESQIATLLICSEYLKFTENELPYYRRQAKAYRAQFAKLHAKTELRVKERLSKVKLREYVCGDVQGYAESVPEESVFITFPPTYKGGYEKMYRKLESVFDWESPRYKVFDEKSFEALSAEVKKKRKWIYMRDKKTPTDEEFLIAEFQPASNTRTVYVYSNMKGQVRITKPYREYDPVLIERASGVLTGDLKLIRLNVSQLNTLRSEYMSRSVAWTATPDIVIGILDAGKLLGVLGFRKISPFYKEMADVYMVADFCICPSIYKRLSKLVLIVAVSKEVKEIIEAEFQIPIKKIFTTIFTEKPVSMKYRGIFELWNRKETGDALNYVSESGRWTMKEGYEEWKKKYVD